MGFDVAFKTRFTAGSWRVVLRHERSWKTGHGPVNGYPAWPSTRRPGPHWFSGGSRPIAAAFSVCIAFLGSAACWPADGFFRGGQLLPSPSFAFSIVDVDGDARPDIAAVEPASGKVSVFLSRPGLVFGPPASYPVGLSPVFVGSGDFNGDGWSDLFTANSGSGTVSVLINDGKGAFLPARDSEAGLQARTAGLADLDRDGNLDVVVISLLSGDVASLSILLGDGRGGFEEPLFHRAGDNVHDLVVEDFDGDGLPDTAVAQTGTIRFFRGKGDGSFEPPVDTDLLSADANPRNLSCGDFDRDGSPDLAILSDFGALLFLKNLGDGKFWVQQVTGSTCSGAQVLAESTDVDGDGAPDLATACGAQEPSTLKIFLGRGNGEFDVPAEVPLGSVLWQIGFADLDMDGILDLVGGNVDPPGLIVYAGIGSGQFLVPASYPLQAGPRGVGALDAQGDGLADIMAMTWTGFYLLRGDGLGDLEPGGSRDLDGSLFDDMLLADLDGDGRAEIAAADLARGMLLVLRLDASGLPAEAAKHAVGPLPHRIAAADLDGDARPDLAVTDRGSPAVTVIFDPLGRGARALELSAGSGQSAIAAGDLDGDGASDLAAATKEGLRILHGDGKGAFPRVGFVDGAASATALRAADLDGDGSDDLIAAAQSEVLIICSLASTGDPERSAIDLGEDLRALEARDLDGDGRMEVVTASRSMVFVLRFSPGGDFAESERYPVGSILQALALEDLDGDGGLDCAAADFRGPSVLILRSASGGRRGFFRRGDADLDGKVVLTDAVVVLERLFLGGAPLSCLDAADTNDDGRLDLTDPIFLLVYLFQGGPELPEPGAGRCGSDPTPDDLEECAGDCR